MPIHRSTSYTYAATTPFTDGNSNTLADVAMHYWKRDLRTDLGNRVPTSEVNPAFWQHMVTYGVGLGVAGTVDPTTALSAITANPPANITWPDPTATNAAKIDDLLHAGVNGHGGFFGRRSRDICDRVDNGIEQHHCPSDGQWKFGRGQFCDATN